MTRKNKKSSTGKNREDKASLKNMMTALVVITLVGWGGWFGYRQIFPGVEISTASTEVVSQGEALFAKNCVSCHGAKGVGENPAAIRGGDKPGGGLWAPALNGKAHSWHHSPDVLFKIVKEGSPNPTSPMRGWGDRMSDEDIRAMLAYVHELWPDRVKTRYRQAFPNG